MAGDVEILYGDPEVAGEPFVMRIRELPGTIVPPHSHPVDENITVVQGTWYFALGDEYNTEALQELKTGSYAFAPKGSSMFGYSPAGSIVQVHGVGPFSIHWRGGLRTLYDPDAKSVFRFAPGEAEHGLRTLYDPDAKSVFRFARGATVVVKGKGGKVAEGYASGKIVQYEIEVPGGERFMATEDEVQSQ